ncbi:MAG: hypothetical protein Q7I98_00980 [Erysipelotrichaceae bacterium]|nr:hypothetical protein [Erysipelotrichaceae bacterium]
MLFKSKLSMLALSFLVLSGCAGYRTNTSRTFDSTSVEKNQHVMIYEDSLPNKKYTDLGKIKAEVKKLTAFHSDPTKEQVNAVLCDKATNLGADAVINVHYKSGIGFSTWGYIEAEGNAVKF